MKITRRQLDLAVDENILEPNQAERLFEFLKRQPTAGPSFDFTHLLYYLGGLIAIGAMTLFMTIGWEKFGGWGLSFIALGYAGVGLKLSGIFQRKGFAVPAGICATFAVALTPLAIYGVQHGLGVWPDSSVYRDYHRYVQWHWMFMELGTLAVGLVVAWKYKYPFLVMPIAATLWYLSMDIAFVFSDGNWISYDLRALVSIYFGLLMLALAFWVDVRARKTADYAFWLYLFGVMTFWGGITSQYFGHDLERIFYCLINLVMLGVGVLLVRRVFVVFGAMGCCFYMGYLASHLFADSLMFPVALTAIGFGIIWLGVLWQKNEKSITIKVRSLLPIALRELLQTREEM